MFPSTERDLSVRNTGAIQIDDVVCPNGDSARALRVTAIKPGPKITCINDGPNAFSVASGERLVPVQGLAATFTDSRGTVATNPVGMLTANAQGFVEFYTPEPRVDIYYSGGGVSPGSRFDVLGGWLQQTLPWLDARDYFSIQDAIDAIPAGRGGIVFVPQGVYEISSTLVLPLGKAVHLRGDGIDQTVLHCSDPSVDIVHVLGDDCTLEGLTIEGPNLATNPQNETSGRGVVVGRLGAGATVLKWFSMRDCHVVGTASWALWLIGWSDAGGVNSQSLSIINLFSRCRFEGNKKFGLVRMRTGCTTQTFEGCSFLYATGWSLLAESVEGVYVQNSVFEDSDDTAPYVELRQTTNVILRDNWFEHHGGHAAELDSNSTPFILIANATRTTVIDSCHFTRHPFAHVANPSIGIYDIIVGDVAFPESGVLNVLIHACDFNLPGPLVVDREVRVNGNSEVLVDGGLALGVSSAPPNPTQFGSPGVSSNTVVPPDGPTRYGSSRVTLVGAGARLRVPRSSSLDRAGLAFENISWQPGDLTYDDSGLWLKLASGWKQLQMIP